jgi:hypothetical protein
LTVPEVGSNVTSFPPLSTAVHCDADAQATETRACEPDWSSGNGPAHET